MTTIKNIIFDLGNVLMNIDYAYTTNAFKNLGYSDFERMYSMFKSNKVFDNLETGHISTTDFYKYMVDAGDGKVSQEDITSAWNAMLIDFRLESFAYLKELRKSHRLFLLSNTNAIHKEAFDKIFEMETGMPSMNVFFEKAYYSNEVGFRKPNVSIFEFILNDAGILAEETFFVDDLYPNIETAKKLGFKTHLLLPGEKIENLEYV